MTKGIKRVAFPSAIGRTPVANVATNGFGSSNAQASSTLIIVIASVVALTAMIGVAVLTSKKKED